ncbi:MAG: hypothetical protein JWO98_3858 [Frankiales bacterium]|nr:hypothetical protein [Frankiales bacterium]
MSSAEDSCDVVTCGDAATGTHLCYAASHSPGMRVCDTDVDLRQAGRRPVLIPNRLDPATLDGPSALLLEVMTA